MQARTIPSPTVVPAPAPVGLLVVEDSDDDYLLLLARLKAGGLAVRARRVETADALGEALATGDWSAVISDHRLPRFSSIEALALVRAHDPDLPFLIVSGAIGEEAAVEGMRAGADDYLMKDKLSRLVPALQRALATADARRARRVAERALGESEERFRALSANLPGMVFQLEQRDGDPALVYVSDGSRRLFGLPPHELLAEPERLLGLFAPRDRDAIRVLLDGCADASSSPAARGPHWLEYIAEILDADGVAQRWIEFTARARRNGERVVWDGIASDITPAKRAERELRASREELRELASYFARVREEERTTVARELHDDIGSTLTGIKFQLAAMRGRLTADDVLAQRVAHLDELVDGVIASSTRLMHDLRPGILDEGIVAALEWQARTFEQRTGLACGFVTTHEEIDLPPEPSMAAFRICQEALNNIVKHAHARAVEIALQRSGDTLRLTIADDGVGIDAAARDKPGHFGLRGMRERAMALGGTVVIAARAPRGTAVTLTLPLTAASDAPSAEEALS